MLRRCDLWVEDSRRDGLEIVKEAQLRVGKGLNPGRSSNTVRTQDGKVLLITELTGNVIYKYLLSAQSLLIHYNGFSSLK